MNTRYPIEAAADAIAHGTRDKAEVYTELHLLKQACEEGMKLLKEELVAEVQQYGNNGVTHNGVKLTCRRGNKRIDWSRCTPVIDAEDVVKDLKKTWEMRALLALKPGGQTKFVDEETGEVILPPIIKYDADTIVATQSKEF